MKISVIIPVYNVESYIYDCLNSVSNQIFDGNIECIVIDDCGTDQSMSIAEKYISEYVGTVTFKIIHHNKNRGLSAARNTGMHVATGDYIIFLDSDDEMTPNALSSLCEPIKTDNYDFVIGDYRLQGSGKQTPTLKLHDGQKLEGEEIRESYLKREWYMMAPNKLYDRKFLLSSKMSFLEGIIHEDDLWSFQLALRAKKIKAIKAVTYIYKLRDGSITTTINYNRRAESFAKIFSQARNEIYKMKLNRLPLYHQYIQRIFRDTLLSAVASNNKKLFNYIYTNIRDKSPIKFEDVFYAYGMNFKELVINLHWILPRKLSARIIWIYLKNEQA